MRFAAVEVHVNYEKGNNRSHVLETIPCPPGSPITEEVVSDQRHKITTDIQAAGQKANRLYPAYQYTALSASPEGARRTVPGSPGPPVAVLSTRKQNRKWCDKAHLLVDLIGCLGHECCKGRRILLQLRRRRFTQLCRRTLCHSCFPNLPQALRVL
ncbi:unnamed protein product [Pleuronectes platessa]|uniref:Uncharacterized protein n=1 Tax=Pleuronectes platessa TaxID=8262 RepID=A0A9N7YNK0_PLEPL|nr:unnamed protein product [Pleuronectes platessa]